MKDIRGVLAALVTPYTVTGEVDYKTLKQMVHLLIDKGIDGFYIGGSTGEAFFLTNEERKHILETVVEEANGRVATIAHIGDIGTKKSIDLGLHAKQIGVDAISSVSPFYYKLSFEEIKKYYSDIVEACEIPMVVYNFPALSGVDFSTNQLGELLSLPYVKGLKHTSLNLYQLERIRQINKDIVIYNGHDEVLLYGMIAGADGGIGSTYNCMPHLFKQLMKSIQEDDLTNAKQLQTRINTVIDYIVKFGVMQSVKELMTHYGIKSEGCRAPFKQLKVEEKQVLKEVFEKYIKE